MLNRVICGRSSNKFRHSLLTKTKTTTTTARPLFLSSTTKCNLMRSSSSSFCHLRFFSANAKDPRQQQSSSTSSSSSSGNYLIKFGWFLLGVVALDQALQYKQEREATEHQAILRQMQHEANTENRVEWDMSLPTLFTCRITHKEISLDGTKMLSNVQVGDVVEVMEASTGPNQAYHLCRRRQINNNDNTNQRNNNKTATMKVGDVGWYPIDYLQKI